MAHHMHKLSKSHFEREDFGLNGGAGIPNPGSTQIYLTFSADSTFKEEDVSNYFSYYWFQNSMLGPRVRVSKRVKGDDGQRVGSRNIGILMTKSIQLLKILKKRRELVGREVTVELKNDLAIQRTLHSLDQYLNIKLQNTRIVDEDNYPHITQQWSSTAELLTNPQFNGTQPLGKSTSIKSTGTEQMQQALNLDHRYIQAYSRHSTTTKELWKLQQSIEGIVNLQMLPYVELLYSGFLSNAHVAAQMIFNRDFHSVKTA
ncbi:hypothetical protein H5410_031761 [Solanum commersonii]|uniref:Sm domain-containing protein n=1 Tax=Solanum commersonii TaxID=4109 RepID=A0A9J5YKW8_SOLCO|nr:hypothetical protein H5410_031761 [Solanum commersonii]